MRRRFRFVEANIDAKREKAKERVEKEEEEEEGTNARKMGCSSFGIHDRIADEERAARDDTRGERKTKRTRPNGQLDGRCAIIASAKIGSLRDARPGNITFRGARYKKRGRRPSVERRNQGGREKWWELS